MCIVLLFSGCEKEESYPVIPEIKYIDFSASYDSGDLGTYGIGNLSFSFVDGDGNIGYRQNSDSIEETPIINDIFIIEYVKLNGVFKLKDTLKYLLPYYEKGVYRKFLKGKIDIKLTRTKLSEDTARYEFYIQDRAYNISNTDTTPIIIYSELLQQ